MFAIRYAAQPAVFPDAEKINHKTCKAFRHPADNELIILTFQYAEWPLF
jgi:hypothetical protein